MSEPKRISPLLDGFIVGETMSAHHGIRCCPALREETEERHIVKIISVPSSKTQLDALLLSGAYTSKEQAQDYFRELAQGILDEVQLLEKLSRLEGFLPYQASQNIELPNYVGFLVCMRSPYQRTLEKQMHREPLTHLAAVNLGLDMCAALTAARRAGYLYADLKPSNIYCTENRGYCIGDLGFIPLSSLKYASLPEKYRSSYIAPEITDAYACLNDTLDIYALGLVLYQVYNNGELPFEGTAPAEPLPSPLYADYEMAEIILKACHPDPQKRWSDPAQMGQALVNYMQRNSVNNTSIVPPPVEIPDFIEEEPEEFLSEDENEAEFAELMALIPDEQPPEDMPELSVQPENAGETAGEDVTIDVAQMLAQADELLALELPEPVVAPDPIDVPIPPPILPEPEIEEPPEEPEPEAITDDGEDEPPVQDEPDYETQEEAPTEVNEETDELEVPGKKRRIGLLLGIAAILAVIAMAIWGGYRYYHNEYIQTVDAITVEGSKNQINVVVVSEIDEGLLTAVCTDTYGNTLRSPIQKGVASFTGLNPSTQYKITLEISGKHKLTGPTTGSYTTAAETQIHNFSAITGATDGSVKLSFTVSGPDSESWHVEYSDGSTTKALEFRGHNVDVNGLTPGTDYTFRLTPKSELYLTGNCELIYTASKLILAQNLRLESYIGGTMSVAWENPEGFEGVKWTVRCENDKGFEQAITTDVPGVEFSGLDTGSAYVITVTAEGMSQSQTLPVGANPINITAITAKPVADAPWLVELAWEFDGIAPPTGWEIRYTAADMDTVTVTSLENLLQLPLNPGVDCEFEIRPVHDGPGFGLSYSYEAPDALPFQGFGDNVTMTLHTIPQMDVWTAEDLGEPVQLLHHGEPGCLLLPVMQTYDKEVVTATFVITGSGNALVSANSAGLLWLADSVCLLTVNDMPATLGTYTLSLYLDNQYVAQITFDIQPAADAAG